MGTSKSNPGLKPTSLLPPWAPPAPDNQSNPADGSEGEVNNDQNDQKKSSTTENPIGDWSTAKGRLTAFTKGSSKAERARSLKGAAKAYVSGSGGSRRISNSAVHGKAAAIRLGGALAGIASEGAARTFDRLGLGDLKDLSVESAFNKLAQNICSNGATTEESIANVAVITALSELYEKFDLENNDLDNLDNLTGDQVNEIIECYVSAYIFERWLHELGMSIEGKDISVNQVVSFEGEIKEFIISQVSLDFSNMNLTTINFDKGHGKEMIDSIFQQAYELIETL